MRVGVAPAQEAERVRETLEAAGWEIAQRIEAPGHVALAFRRREQRAVRVVRQSLVVSERGATALRRAADVQELFRSGP